MLLQRAVAQNKISTSVLGNGATTTAGGDFKIVGTLGQPIIGVAGNAATTSASAGFWYGSVNLITRVEEIESEFLPTEFHLDQNYPNPFNPSTTIQFALPKASHVTIKIYDLLGREVTTLIDEEHQAGQYKVVFKAGQLPSGLYVYRIQASDFRETKKLMLLK